MNWDTTLRNEMEVNIEKAVKYIGQKIEQKLKIDDDTLKFGSRASKTQLLNYRLLNVAHEISRLSTHFYTLNFTLICTKLFISFNIL